VLTTAVTMLWNFHAHRHWTFGSAGAATHPEIR
jgi:hypothetical protein